jgi:hypothetical protein
MPGGRSAKNVFHERNAFRKIVPSNDHFTLFSASVKAGNAKWCVKILWAL